MSVNFFLHRYTVHVPSIARARILPTAFLRRPMIYIDCYNGRDQEIVYPIGSWDKAKTDYEGLQTEMHRCQAALATMNPNASPVVKAKSKDSDSDLD